MSLNRRSILALLGGAVASPAIGVKTAASALGLETALVPGSGLSQIVDVPIPVSSEWWGSPLQIAMEIKERATSEMRHGNPYPHMKSWGHGFRSMAIQRDLLVMEMYRRKMQEDASFREKVLTALGVMK